MPAGFFSFPTTPGTAASGSLPSTPSSSDLGLGDKTTTSGSGSGSIPPPSTTNQESRFCHGFWGHTSTPTAPAAESSSPPAYSEHQPANSRPWGPWQSWSTQNHRGFFEREGFFEGEEAARNRERFAQAGKAVADFSEATLLGLGAKSNMHSGDVRAKDAGDWDQM